MQNYRGNTNDYMRRGNYGRNCNPNGCPGNGAMPASISPSYPAYRDVSPCCEHDDVLEGLGLPIAMAYVPWQTWENLYCPETALCQGTIFEDLDKPFLGGCNS